MGLKDWWNRVNPFSDQNAEAMVRRIKGEKEPDFKAIVAKAREQIDPDLMDHFLRVNHFGDTVALLQEHLKGRKDWGNPRISHRDNNHTLPSGLKGDDGVFWTFTVKDPKSRDEILLTLAHWHNPNFVQERQQQVVVSIMRKNEEHGVQSLWRFGTHQELLHDVMKNASYSSNEDESAYLPRLCQLLKTWSDQKLPVEMQGGQGLSESRIKRRESAALQIQNGIEMLHRRYRYP